MLVASSTFGVSSYVLDFRHFARVPAALADESSDPLHPRVEHHWGPFGKRDHFSVSCCCAICCPFDRTRLSKGLLREDQSMCCQRQESNLRKLSW